MPQIQFLQIGPERQADIKFKNEPFALFGRMVPTYENGVWSYRTEKLETPGQDLFPNENYDFAQMEKSHIFIGAYDGDRCVGLAILEKQWYKYIYLADLKVCGAYRGQRIATGLLAEAGRLAKALGYRGIWTVGQDNNLAACLCYVCNGFRIGGLDTEVYNGTKLQGVSDIHFYKEV